MLPIPLLHLILFGACVLGYTCIWLSSSVLCVAKEEGLGPNDNICPIQNAPSECPYSSGKVSLAEEGREFRVYSRDRATSDQVDPAKKNTDVVKRNSLFSFVGSTLSGVSNGLSTAVNKIYKSAKDTGDKIYNKIKNTTLELMEAVRRVLQEEFESYYIIESAVSTILNTAIAPGKVAMLLV